MSGKLAPPPPPQSAYVGQDGKPTEEFHLWIMHNLIEGVRETRTIIPLDGVTANTFFVVPAGWYIADIFAEEVAGHAITGGLKIGTVSGGTNVIANLTVGANSIGHASDVQLPKRIFSKTADTKLFVQAVTNWSGAKLNLRVATTRAF
jgi:hypothetical protein